MNSIDISSQAETSIIAGRPVVVLDYRGVATSFDALKEESSPLERQAAKKVNFLGPKVMRITRFQFVGHYFPFGLKF